MALTNSATGFGSVAKAFHWAVVLLFLNQYVVATIMIMMNKNDTVFGLSQGWYYTWHKSVGLLILAISWFGTWRLWRRGEPGPWLARGLVAMTFAGWVATLAGWYTTEIGRQPWLVNGVMRTYEAVADVPAPMVLSTLLVYLAIYVGLTLAYVSVLFYLARKAARGETPRPMTPASGAAEVALVPGE